MRRRFDVSSFKPQVELLEDRIQPSFLLSGAVSSLSTPLNNMVTDMKNASADLKTQFAALTQFGEENTSSPTFTAHLPIEETAYGKAVGDWQRILTDQHAINALSSADVSFVNAVAFQEAVAGDTTDLLVLKFGPMIGLNATASLTTPVSQAANVVADTTLQADINADPAVISALYTGTTIAQAASTPGF
jgi:hypothetical protein